MDNPAVITALASALVAVLGAVTALVHSIRTRRMVTPRPPGPKLPS